MDIICSSGLNFDSVDIIGEIAEAGMSVYRLNCSHIDHLKAENHISYIKNNYPDIKIALDLRGKKIRVSNLFKDSLKVVSGVEVNFCSEEYFRNSMELQYDLPLVPLSLFCKFDEINSIDTICMKDGKMKFDVIEICKDEEVIRTKTINGGIIRANKGVNIPGLSRVNSEILVDDEIDIEWGITNDIDVVILSYVESAHDIECLKKIINKIKKKNAINRKIEIWAKIETKNGLNNYKNILAKCDAIMMGRGDMRAEVEPYIATVEIDKIMHKMKKSTKKLIIATNVVDSMALNSVPTINDMQCLYYMWKNNVNAVMLAEEITVGKYPVDTVKYVNETIRYFEDC